MSFNQIERMEGLESAGLTSLASLYLSNNRIGRIDGLAGLPSLRLLELGSNAIRVVENLSSVQKNGDCYALILFEINYLAINY